MKKCGLITEKGNLVPHVSVEIQISGFVGHVISHLQYENNEDTPIEAEFTFPLDDGSAVYKFEAVIEDRHIIAECQEKEEARKTYDDAIAAGDTAMLLEEDDSSGDIFRCLVGNLPAKTTAKLIIGYVIELPVEHDGKLLFTLPVILNPRYSPNVEGLESAKGATYALRQKDIPYSFKLSATVDGSKEVKSITASQPHIDVQQGSNKKQAKVVFKDDFTFDSDVRLFVEYDNMYEPECLVETGDAEKTGFLAEDVLMVNLFPKIDTVGSTSKGEYIFVLDRSGSMGFGANRISNAKEALLLFLKSLPVGCYFNIVSFGSRFEFLFADGSKEYTEKSLEKAVGDLKKMEANFGGTEILRPLKAIYEQKTLQEHPRQIFLLTDGEVGNVREVVDIARKNASNTRVFTIGIGEGASTALVNGVARAGNGKAEFIKDSERMQPKVMSLLKFAMQPSITDVSIGWELPSSVTAITMPETPACLFDGDRLILYALLQGHAEPQISGKVFINGKTDKGPANFSANFFVDKSGQTSSSAPFHRLAAKAQIKLLEDKEDSSDETKQKIIAVSVASNMASKHTSFVAIDKERKEKVTGKQIRRAVPIMADMQYCSLGSANLLCAGLYDPGEGKTLKQRAFFKPFSFSFFKRKEKVLDSSKLKSSAEEDEIIRANIKLNYGKKMYPRVLACAAAGPPQMMAARYSAQHMGMMADELWHLAADNFLKTFWPKEKLLVTSKFSFGQNVFIGSGAQMSRAHARCLPKKSGGIMGKLFSKKKKMPSNNPDNVTLGDAMMDMEDGLDNDITMPKSSGDPMMDMISFQSFQGNWKLTSEVCKALKVEIKVLKGLQVSENDDILATLAVLVWLQLSFNDRFDEWEMIKTKAMSWLNGQGLDDTEITEKMQMIKDSLASEMKI